MADSNPRLSISLIRKIKLIEEVEANPHKLKKAIQMNSRFHRRRCQIFSRTEKSIRNNFTPETTCWRNETEVDAELLKWFKGLRYVLPEYAHEHSRYPTPPPSSLSLSLSLSLWALHDLSSHVPAKNRTAIWCNVHCHTCFYCRFSLWLFAFRLTLSSYRKRLQTIGDWKTTYTD